MEKYLSCSRQPDEKQCYSANCMDCPSYIQVITHPVWVCVAHTHTCSGTHAHMLVLLLAFAITRTGYMASEPVVNVCLYAFHVLFMQKPTEKLPLL